MKISKVTLSKELKVGLPNYSNVSTRCEITFDVSEDETPNWDEMWQEVNYQMFTQNNDIDPNWISAKEYKNFFKIKVKK